MPSNPTEPWNVVAPAGTKVKRKMQRQDKKETKVTEKIKWIKFRKTTERDRTEDELRLL